jgi:hypothetical protein
MKTTDRHFRDRMWRPGSTAGYLVSTVSVILLSVLFWLIAFAPPTVTLASLSPVQYLGGVSLGLLLSAGTLGIHARPNWRDRWRTSWRLRLGSALPTAGSLAVVAAADPAVVSVGFVVLAVCFTLGRTYLYAASLPPRN